VRADKDLRDHRNLARKTARANESAAWDVKNTGNKNINGATRGLKNPGIGTDYLMAVIYIKEFRNQNGVTAYSPFHGR